MSDANKKLIIIIHHDRSYGDALAKIVNDAGYEAKVFRSRGGAREVIRAQNESIRDGKTGLIVDSDTLFADDAKLHKFFEQSGINTKVIIITEDAAAAYDEATQHGIQIGTVRGKPLKYPDTLLMAIDKFIGPPGHTPTAPRSAAEFASRVSSTDMPGGLGGL